MLPWFLPSYKHTIWNSGKSRAPHRASLYLKIIIKSNGHVNLKIIDKWCTGEYHSVTINCRVCSNHALLFVWFGRSIQFDRSPPIALATHKTSRSKYGSYEFMRRWGEKISKPLKMGAMSFCGGGFRTTPHIGAVAIALPKKDNYSWLFGGWWLRPSPR